jgi:hypothetical protein
MGALIVCVRHVAPARLECGRGQMPNPPWGCRDRFVNEAATVEPRGLQERVGEGTDAECHECAANAPERPASASVGKIDSRGAARQP